MKLHIVFDGPPGPVAGRFVEVENDAGRSLSVGYWVERPDGLWELVIDTSTPGLGMIQTPVTNDTQSGKKGGK